MSEAEAYPRHTTHNAFHVMAPRVGDVLSGTLHSVYDQQGDLPSEFASLLGQLDGVKFEIR